ncbi:YciK family oxidoreductase [Brumicola nitratireducens]|uniref:Short chain dehydrogenase n=1 Tax=Glaciecola nitratireducens (strain JCM 12485 / KCTC 12276 / FR1064) TaxID=1085623 RepID=G4QLL1_GLANF|nr:YciK family oxidoreductase [Glaciecola nitratireducens]AEP30117.1 short chain dehydrogenase [Glaciecola nitratireducens FR1064]
MQSITENAALQYKPANNALENKVVIVTGAGDGIGKQAAITFAKHGAELILLGKTVSKLESTYDEIINNGGVTPAIVPIDFKGATPKHYQEMVASIEGQYKKIDVVLFNASVLGNLCPFEEIKESEFLEVNQVNLNSQFFMTQALLPLLKLNKSASVIYTTSSVGRNGRAYWGTYSISKFATEGMMQVLADEYKNTGVRFNCINPGATRTTMRAKAFPGEKPDSLKTPSDIMPSYLYLASDDSKGVNGQSLDCQPK